MVPSIALTKDASYNNFSQVAYVIEQLKTGISDKETLYTD